MPLHPPPSTHLHRSPPPTRQRQTNLAANKALVSTFEHLKRSGGGEGARELGGVRICGAGTGLEGWRRRRVEEVRGEGDDQLSEDLTGVQRLR